MARQKRIEVVEAPAERDLSSIPEAVTDYFASAGMHASLASAHETVVAQSAIAQRYAITTDDFPEDPAVRKMLTDDLRQYGFRITPEGMVKRGDCYLYIQSEEAREAIFREGRELWERQNSLEAAHNQAAEIQGMIPAGKGRAWLQEDTGTLSSHVNPTI